MSERRTSMLGALLATLGPMSDAFGRKNATLAFVGINLLGSLICAFALSVEWLLAGRLIQGVGASVGMTVARAMVRDQFVGAEASRIMNLIGIMLAIGPAMAPTLGGLALVALGWQAIFFLLIGFGLLAIFAVLVFMRETSTPDPRRARPGPLVQAYGELIRDPRFVAAAIVLGGSVGALYAQSTMLSFILIDRVGMSPTAFGIGMLMQTGSYFAGSVALRMTAARLGGEGSVRVGLACCGIGGLLIALSVHFLAPSYLSVMLPVAFSSFGIAFLTPHMTTAALQSFPHIAGSAFGDDGFHPDGRRLPRRIGRGALGHTLHRLRPDHPGHAVPVGDELHAVCRSDTAGGSGRCGRR